MTASTEQERAEFEKWWSSPHIWGRGHKEAQWASWQAARRAPAVPETIEQRAKKLKGLQVLIGATAGVPEAIELARSRFTEAYGRSPLHDDLAYACLLIDAYGGAPVVPVPQGLREAAQAVVERWDTPLWKDVPATAVYIANLRAALAAAPQPQEAEDGPSSCAHCGNPWGEAAPVPQGWKLVPDANNMTDEQAEAICNLVSCCGGGAHEVYEAALAAAPQPPEADMGIPISASALAQLPEIDIDTANHAGIRVRGYTQETVRQLLAAHGIEVAP